MKRASTRRCKAPSCHERFAPDPPWIEHCSTDCGAALGILRIEKAKAAKAKADRKVDKVRKDKLKTKADWTKEAQDAIALYVRTRDARKSCVSCGAPPRASYALTGGAWDCGHMRSVGTSKATRFNLHNLAKQCKRCNRDMGGAAIDFRREQVKRIGLDKVEAVEQDNRVRKFTVEYLQRLKRIFTKKAKRLLRRMEG